MIIFNICQNSQFRIQMKKTPITFIRFSNKPFTVPKTGCGLKQIQSSPRHNSGVFISKGKYRS